MSPEHLQIHHTRGEPRKTRVSRLLPALLLSRVTSQDEELTHPQPNDGEPLTQQQWAHEGSPIPPLRDTKAISPGLPPQLGFLLAAQKPFSKRPIFLASPMAQMTKLKSNFHQGQRIPLVKQLLSH